MNKNNNKPKKYALDSSATFYPYFTTHKTQSMFCVGAVLNDVVDKQVLENAVNDAILRFPLYKTRVRRGLGAYYLQENGAHVKVFDLDNRVLIPINKKLTNRYQFRLSCGGRRVKLEIFHALTDANGAVKFLSAILRRYRELQGVEFAEDCAIDKCNDPVPASELEDSFKRYSKLVPKSALDLKGMAGGASHRIRGTIRKDGYMLDERDLEVVGLIEKSKAAGVSATAYIAGVVGYSILKSSRVKKPIVLMVPVNLRKIFPSDTASNFVTFVRLIIKKGECKTLDDCVQSCAKQLAEKATKDKMGAFISTTVRAQKNIILRCVPLFLMWIFVRLGRLFMKSRQTMIISNMGNISLPSELGVEKLTFNLNVSKNNVQNLAAISYGGNCRLTFTSAIEELTVPNAVFDTLVSQGINVAKVDFNCQN